MEQPKYQTYVDGGVFANNPTGFGVALIRVREQFHRSGRYGPNHPWLILSLGTGRVAPSASIENVEDAGTWGLLDWVGPILDIMFSESGLADEPEGANLFVGVDQYYFRLQPQTLSVENSKLDNARSANIRKLKQEATAYIKSNGEKLDKLYSLLRREKPRECRGFVP